MNREQRRRMGQRGSQERGPLPLCPPLHHVFRETTGRYRGEDVHAVVACEGCGRTWQQVLLESPEDRAAFETFMREQREQRERS